MPKEENKLYDKECLDKVDNNVNMTIPWYLMAAYAYYEQDNPILSDGLFDRLARKIDENWDLIDHIHKDHITRDALKAGTFLGKYPSRVEGAVKQLRMV